MPGPRPVRELDAELVGRLGVLDEIAFVDVEKPQQVDQGGNRRLAHADPPDVGRLDDGDDAAGTGQRPSQYTCRHPAGGAAAHDRDTFDLAVVGHVARTAADKKGTASHGGSGVAVPGL